MKWVYICSPLRGNNVVELHHNRERAIDFCRYAMRTEDNILPIAPHVYCTTFLDDNSPAELEAGMQMGIDLLRHCQEIWVYGSRISEGMKTEIKEAYECGLAVRYFDEQGNYRGDVTI